jgi:hypothetical protein
MRATLQSFMTLAILLPESFRGGCSFGVGGTDLSRKGISKVVCLLYGFRKRDKQ